MPPPDSSRTRRAHLVVLALLASACACATTRRTPPAPIDVDVRHYAGTVLTGPTAEMSQPEGNVQALGLALRIALVERAPTGAALVPRLVVVEGVDEPFGTRSELALGARRAASSGAVTSLWQTGRLEALLPGATTVLALEPNVLASGAPTPPWQRLELELSRRASDPRRLETALDLSGWIRPRPPSGPFGDDEPAPIPEQRSVRERLLFEGAPAPGDPPWVLVFPAPAPGHPEAAVVIEIELPFSHDAGALAEAVARAGRNLESSRRAVEVGGSVLSDVESFRIQSGSALRALAQRHLSRPALLYLASETRAELVAELALVADVEALGDFLARGQEAVAALPEGSIDVPGLGWLLESTAWRWLAARAAQEQGEAPLTPELEALLLRKAGEAGRWPDLLADAVAESDGIETLRERIERENRIFLEDADPAARVRAFDWLQDRGLAPEGYDPLASAHERREVLARLEAQTLEPAAGEEDVP